MQNFRLLTTHVKCHQICTLISSFWWKYIKISPEKVQRTYVSWHWRVTQNLKKNWFVVSIMTSIWWILMRAPESLKHLHFDWFLLCKVYHVSLKKVLRSYLSWYWTVFQNFKKNWLVVWKMTGAIWNIFTRALWWNPFIQSRKCVRLKVTEKLCVMTKKNNAKFGEELTCRLKIGMRKVTNFEPSTQKSRKFAL